METAGEIIFFWVARMIILSLYITGKVPFKTVYLHGLVLDAKGQKMSKSKSNVINPLDLTEKYGTDAFRMGLIVGNTPGTSLSLSEDKIKGQKHFSNKLWNISRFILMNMGDNIDLNKKPELGDKEKSYLTEFNELVKDVTKDLDEFRFYLAGEKLYHYIWHTFADKIIEEEKAAIKNNSSEAKWLLLSILTASLKLLHPFMPFVTEEIYSKLPIKNKKLLLVEEWPSADL